MAYTQLLYHVVFSTKERRPFITPELMPRLAGYVGGIIRAGAGNLLAANGSGDHLHMCVRLTQTVSLADSVRLIKTNSSKWIHGEVAGLRAFAWQDGYGAFTVSRSATDDVIRCIQAQAEHRQKMTFQEEFLSLLRKHDIEYDERYIWS